MRKLQSAYLACALFVPSAHADILSEHAPNLIREKPQSVIALKSSEADYVDGLAVSFAGLSQGALNDKINFYTDAYYHDRDLANEAADNGNIFEELDLRMSARNNMSKAIHLANPPLSSEVYLFAVSHGELAYAKEKTGDIDGALDALLRAESLVKKALRMESSHRYEAYLYALGHDIERFQ